MKYLLPLLALASLAASNRPAPPSPELLAVKSIYLLPMRSGFDQYLANEITRTGVFRVVVDPARADAVLTDRLGESFEQRLDNLVPTPPPPPAPAAVPETTEEKSTDVKKKTPTVADAITAAGSSTRPVSSMAVGRGNVFLVDRHSRLVLWSDFRQPHGYTPKDLKRAADGITSDLKRALQPPEAETK